MEPVQTSVGLWPILSKQELGPGFFSLVFHAPDIARQNTPGRFVHIRCGDYTLRRPLSICEQDPEQGTVRIVFEVRGKGTGWLSQRVVGESLDVLGPAGNGFDLSRREGKILLVGGGIGTPPLLGIAKQRDCDSVLGYRCGSACILTEEFQEVCGQTVVVTEDGSLGEKGLVTGPVSELLSQENYACICACGPIPMLKAVAALAEERGVPCLLSLEQRMACGAGACLCCVCKVKVNDGEAYVPVCKVGPVFDSKKVVFE